MRRQPIAALWRIALCARYHSTIYVCYCLCLLLLGSMGLLLFCCAATTACMAAQGTAPDGGGRLLAVGRARAAGIQMPGRAELLSLTAFEAASGSKAHRPNEFTFASVSQSLQARGRML